MGEPWTMVFVPPERGFNLLVSEGHLEVGDHLLSSIHWTWHGYPGLLHAGLHGDSAHGVHVWNILEIK